MPLYFLALRDSLDPEHLCRHTPSSYRTRALHALRSTGLAGLRLCLSVLTCCHLFFSADKLTLHSGGCGGRPFIYTLHGQFDQSTLAVYIIIELKSITTVSKRRTERQRTSTFWTENHFHKHTSITRTHLEVPHARGQRG